MIPGQRRKPVGSTLAGCRSGRVIGRVGSTLGDRCVIGRPHKMQSGTSTKRDRHNRLKLTPVVDKLWSQDGLPSRSEMGRFFVDVEAAGGPQRF